MTTKTYKGVTKVTTTSVYGNEIAVSQTQLLGMSQSQSQSMLTTKFSIINLRLCGKFSFDMQNYIEFMCSFFNG